MHSNHFLFLEVQYRNCEKITAIIIWLVKKFLSCYREWKFITMITGTCSTILFTWLNLVRLCFTLYFEYGAVSFLFFQVDRCFIIWQQTNLRGTGQQSGATPACLGNTSLSSTISLVSSRLTFFLYESNKNARSDQSLLIWYCNFCQRKTRGILWWDVPERCSGIYFSEGRKLQCRSRTFSYHWYNFPTEFWVTLCVPELF
jgi:hypothetical protein